jgi:predicted transcriptional regulator
MFTSLVELLESAGPLALNELAERSTLSLAALAHTVANLRRSGIVVVRGPAAENLSKMTAEEIAHSSDTIVELSRRAARRSFQK